jgi:hypothetical protein
MKRGSAEDEKYQKNSSVKWGKIQDMVPILCMRKALNKL